jgi:hypothetical protein
MSRIEKPVEPLSDEQFAALTKLLRMRKGKREAAARLMFVEGLPLAAAAAQTGISLPNACNVKKSCQDGVDLAHRVAKKN